MRSLTLVTSSVPLLKIRYSAAPRLMNSKPSADFLFPSQSGREPKLTAWLEDMISLLGDDPIMLEVGKRGNRNEKPITEPIAGPVPNGLHQVMPKRHLGVKATLPPILELQVTFQFFTYPISQRSP